MKASRFGYSLLELLAVVAVISLLAVLSVPAIGSIVASMGIQKATDEITGLLEFAKTEAMARKTYVWVGFANIPTSHPSNGSGKHVVAAAVFASPDGIPQGGAPLPISRLSRLENVKLIQGFGGTQLGTNLKSMLQGMASQFYSSGDPAWKNRHMPPTPLFPDSETIPNARAGLTVGGITLDHSLTFTPQGEAMLSPEPNGLSGFENVIDLAIKPTHGDQLNLGSTTDAVIWIYGATGRIRILRL